MVAFYVVIQYRQSSGELESVNVQHILGVAIIDNINKTDDRRTTIHYGLSSLDCNV